MRIKLFFSVVFAILFFFLSINADVEVKKVNSKNIDKILSAENNKAVFVNVWATWCKPCREEFPDIIKLYDKYSGSGVKFVSISADYTDEIESKIKPFLSKYNVPFKVYVQDFSDQQDLISYIHKNWNGALPFTMIIDSKGKKSAFLIGKQSYEKFEKEIKKNI